MIELIVATTLAATAAALLVGGLRSIGRASSLASARRQVVATLQAARSHAYRSATPAQVRVQTGSRTLMLQRDGLPDQARDLPAQTRIEEAPRRAAVRFFASGLADNATISVAIPGATGSPVRTVVNQRAMIR